jgi:hypothetical protein
MTPPITTAHALLAAVLQHNPSADGSDLMFATDPPAELDALLSVLHTGVRAALTGRRWWGCSTGKPRVIELNPKGPVPAGVTLLSVEGDEQWDRVAPDAPLDHPALFVPTPTKDR